MENCARCNQSCANDVLKIFKSAGLNITQDIRNIIKITKKHLILEIENSSYLNIGILCIIKPHDNLTLKLSFNIDGIRGTFFYDSVNGLLMQKIIIF